MVGVPDVHLRSGEQVGDDTSGTRGRCYWFARLCLILTNTMVNALILHTAVCRLLKPYPVSA
eukprot:2476682-Rhodomonas_salina.1